MSAENTIVTQVFLGVIAMATLVMALVQVGFILYGWTVIRRVSRMLDRIEPEVKPVLEGLNAMARDGARASALAVVQVERVDRLLADLTARIEDTASTVQRAILTPLREGAAMVAGVKAVLSIIRELTGRSGSAARAEDEDALFIG